MKKISRPQYHRIRRILAMIREGMRKGRYPNATDFCRELGVSRPTVMRDIEFLRDEDRAPIDYVPTHHGYRLSDQTWNLPPMELSRDEVFAFAIARQLLEAFRGTPLEIDMASVFQKITTTLQGKVTVDVESLTDHFSVIGEDYVVQDRNMWSAVARFLDRQEQIKIVYRKFSGQIGTYNVLPYHLYAYHGNWYVVGMSRGHDEPATFALSRVTDIQGTGEYFEIPDSFAPREYFQRAFGIVRGGKPFRVRLHFSSSVATYVRERHWHPTQEIVEKRDGSILLTFETVGWQELVRWILSWQPDVRVISPKKLRERVETKMRQGLGIDGGTA